VRIAILSLGLLAAVAASVRADEESIKPADLPKAVASAVKARYPKGEITKAVKEEEHGKTIYEVIVKVEGKTLVVALSAEGKILEVEQAIAAEALPRAVAAAIAAKYPAAKIKKAERIVKFEDDEEETSFEVVLATEGKGDVEVELSPKGKILEDDEDDKPGEKKDKD
jgi:hypothetical protein